MRAFYEGTFHDYIFHDYFRYGAVLYILCHSFFSSLVFIHLSFVYLLLSTSLALIRLGCSIIPDLTQELNNGTCRASNFATVTQRHCINDGIVHDTEPPGTSQYQN